MGKKIIIFASVFIVIIALVGYVASQMIHVTGPVIWVDRSLTGGWKTDKAMGQWWDELSKLNPLAADRSKMVVVYLLPILQTSQVAVGRRDKPRMAYADWRMWGGANSRALTISVDWEEWESMGPGQREIRFAEFVATQLAEHWGVPNQDYEEMTLKILRSEMAAPIELTSPIRGEM